MNASELVFEIFSEAHTFWQEYAALKNQAEECGRLDSTPENIERYSNACRAVNEFPGKAIEHFGPKVAMLIGTKEALDRVQFVRGMAIALAHSCESDFDSNPIQAAKKLAMRADLVAIEIDKRLAKRD